VTSARVDSEGTTLFAYGTLMFPEVWERIAGRPFAAERGAILGFAVRRVVVDVYPVLIPAAPSSRVDGLVLRDIDHETLARLDAYESEFYDRIEVTATLDDSQSLRCQAYMLPERNRCEASDEVWDAEDFAARWLKQYLRRLS
jgi:gamma-glutamylcyclotransferase (GGCT)/AIG2-like uncharacterized protein YtfP